MPLLKADAFGNIYQFGFGNEGQKAEITSQEGDVVYGEFGKKKEQRRAMAARRDKMRKQKLLNQKKKALANEARKKQQAKIQDQKKAAILRNQKQAFIAKQNAEYMRAAKDGIKNPFNSSFSKATSGDELVGFQSKGKVVNRKKLGQGYVKGSIRGDERGNTMLQSWQVDAFEQGYNWPPKRGRVTKQARVIPQSKVQVLPIAKLINNKNNYSYSHPLAFPMKDVTPMGGFFKKAFRSIKKSIKKVVPRAVGKVVNKASKLAGKVMMAPLKLSNAALTKLPIVKNVYKGVDKLTGGTITSLYKTALLPGRALGGQKISKAELLEGVMNIVKVGAIVVSGGAALSVVAAAASALKSGPLGKTSFGRTLLSIGEFASVNKIAGTGLSQALQKKAQDMVQSKVSTEVGKKLGPIGAIAAGAAVSAGVSGVGGNPKTPGDKMPSIATAASAKTAKQLADNAGVAAMKKFTESGMKFSTAAATEEAKKVVLEQSKGLVAQEFKKRTGIPLDVATDVAQGKFPSTTELKKKLMTDLRNGPEHIKAELLKISEQAKNPDVLMKKVLAEKQKIYEQELAKRLADIEKVKNFSAKELVDYNVNKFKPKAELFYAKVNEMDLTSKQAQALREKMNGQFTNMADKEHLAKQVLDLDNKLLAMQKEVEPLGTEVANMSLESEAIKEDGAARLAIAEFGGATKYTTGTGVADDSDLRHPMLVYGMV